MSVNDGGPAFPMASGPGPMADTATHHNEGMSLRDWFAGMALNGLMAKSGGNGHPELWDTFARISFELADAMLDGREKLQGN